MHVGALVLGGAAALLVGAIERIRDPDPFGGTMHCLLSCRSVGCLILLAVLMVACDRPPDDEADRARERRAADAVRLADERFDPVAFEELEPLRPETVQERGRVIYEVSCAKCHGPEGRGDGGFVFQGDTLQPRSFSDPDWERIRVPMELRRMIYVGTAEGMPHWGIRGLRVRDVDAVAAYVERELIEG